MIKLESLELPKWEKRQRLAREGVRSDSSVKSQVHQFELKNTLAQKTCKPLDFIGMESTITQSKCQLQELTTSSGCSSNSIEEAEVAQAYQVAGSAKARAGCTPAGQRTAGRKRASSVAVEKFLELNPPKGMVVNPALKRKIV